MFRRVFIANRGEVAARVARACQGLGIEAVFGASQADLEAGFPYLEEAAEVVALGPGPASDSYLRMDSLVQAAIQTGCSAVHPGWGFLAENSRFAALLKAHGLTFIGPSPRAIDLMGRKLPARAAAEAAGLPVVPGSGLLRSADEAIEAAKKTGYPILLKADAGGGGRGIRRCENGEETRIAFVEASRESAAAFGCADLYLEKFLSGGRHVEFQVFGDGKGEAVHLFERDCSLQRRHQKILEEAPCPSLSAKAREEFGRLCARATASWGYSGAGTLEFLMDKEDQLHFLEMNTRLQVEHPVTEEICGVDLAKAQIQVAAGEGLPWKQEDIRLQGHAIEARINAEDPENDFRPSPGTVDAFQFEGDGIRVETHLAPGSAIPPHYDSLMGKVIAHADTREEAITRLDACLEKAKVGGSPTTAALHRRILAHPDFQASRIHTRWLEESLLS